MYLSYQGLNLLLLKKHLNLLSQAFKIDFPEELIKAVEACKNNNEVKQVGIEWAIQQSKELKAAGVPVLHVLIQWENRII